MMNQIYKKTEENKSTQSTQSFKEEFEELKSEKVEKADTKIINFYMVVGCGCGGNYAKYHAEVPIDQEIKGIYFRDFQPWMKDVKKGWV